MPQLLPTKTYSVNLASKDFKLAFKGKRERYLVNICKSLSRTPLRRSCGFGAVLTAFKESLVAEKPVKVDFKLVSERRSMTVGSNGGDGIEKMGTMKENVFFPINQHKFQFETQIQFKVANSKVK